MKFNIDAKLLATELSAIAGIIDKKASVSSNEYVLIETVGGYLKLTVSSGQMQTESWISYISQKSIKMCLPVKKLLELVKLLDGAVEIEVDDKGHGHVRCGKAKFKLSSITPDLFVKIDAEFDEPLTLPAQELRSIIQLTQGFIGEDDSRYVYSGGKLDFAHYTMSLTGTDGQRMSYSETEIEEDFHGSVLIPHRALLQLRNMIGNEDDVKMAVSRDLRDNVSKMKFRIGMRFLTTNLTTGAFPNVDLILNAETVTQAFLNVDKHDLHDALRRTMVVNEDGSRVVQLFIDGDGEELALSTDGIDTGSDRVQMTNFSIHEDCDTLAIGLNGDHLTKFLTVVKEASPGNAISIKYAGSNNFVELTPAKEDKVRFRYLVAPIRII